MADPKSKTASRKIAPLVSCSKNISSHKKQLQFSSCETEIELILARSACFQTPGNIHDMTICPLYRVSLGIGWRRSKRVCSVPGKLKTKNKYLPLQDVMSFREIGFIPYVDLKKTPFSKGYLLKSLSGIPLRSLLLKALIMLKDFSLRH